MDKTNKSPKKLLSINNLSVKLGNQTILKNINLEVKKGEQIALIGLNGAGKSTLLKTIIGEIKPTNGTVKKSTLKIGYVPQKLNLDQTIPLTSSEFVRLYNNLTKDKIQTSFIEFGLADLKDKQISKLSGGELQKVLILNAAIKQPDLLLLDEPTASIDLEGEKQFYELIKKIRVNYNPALIIVSHNLHTVLANTDHVICLNQHICCHGTPLAVTQNIAFKNIFGKHLTTYSHEHDHKHNH